METYIGAIDVKGYRVETLLTVHEDGTHELATRLDPWETWSRPEILAPAPNSVGSQP